MILHGDCIDKLKTFPTNYFDSVVTDAPYGLKFMGKKWDYSVPSVDIWREVLRVLKPGGHLLSFGGTRTYHRMVVNIEDAGFEIRDQIQWLYGSGFPKSHDISKAIDKLHGAEREVVGIKKHSAKQQIETFKNSGDYILTAPATEDAKRFQGWGSALKPANEPICMARKPIEGTLAQNALKWGCGGINVDASRIGTSDPVWSVPQSDKISDSLMVFDKPGAGSDSMFKNKGGRSGSSQGRWPANVILDEEAAAVLPVDHKGDSVSRFFYCAKASKSERNAGLEGMPSRKMGMSNGAQTHGEGYDKGQGIGLNVVKEMQNFHPTIKPLKLMEYLIKLVTPPGGIVLDPFAGSGTTLVAAKRLGFQYVGIEREKEYCEISEKRLDAVS